jgi:hypothetical protein
MRRSKHPNKEIEGSISYAEENGWTYKDSGKSAHAWGQLLCPLHTREGHRIMIWSTPRSSYNHAQQIRRAVDKCQHEAEEKIKNESN